MSIAESPAAAGIAAQRTSASEEAAGMVRRTCAEQGLEETVGDGPALDRIAALIGSVDERAVNRGAA